MRGLSILLLGTILMPVAACTDRDDRRIAHHQPIVSGVIVSPVVEEDLPETIEAVGTVKAKNSAVIAARIPGTIRTIVVREGDRVRKGALLMQIEAAEAAAGASAAAAGVEEARRGVDEAVARKALADATFQRYQRLYAEEAVSKQEYETRLMEKEVAGQGLLRAEAQLAGARQREAGAGVLAAHRTVVSPVNGTVTAKASDIGMTVFPGTPLVTIEEQGSFRLEIAAPESLAGTVLTGMTLPVAIDGSPATERGRVAEVVPTIDPVSRTFTVKIDLSGDSLRSGMYGRARFAKGSTRGITVPRASVIQRGTLTSVWTVDAAGTAHLRLIKTGRVHGDRMEILAGLSAGDRVVTGGVEKVVDGAKIQ